MSRQPYRSFADAAEKPVWVPVVNPRPSYENLSEKLRWEHAAESNPRREGESLLNWIGRVIDAAKPVADRELPRGDRQPGEDE